MKARRAMAARDNNQNYSLNIESFLASQFRTVYSNANFAMFSVNDGFHL